MRRAAPRTASPLDQTLMAKKAIAVSRLRKEPTIRPTTPKCALEDTALLVPLMGPKIAIGARTNAPTPTPSRLASTACDRDRPNMIGKAPSTAVASEVDPPQQIRAKSKLEAPRSASGIDSTPCRSIVVTPAFLRAGTLLVLGSWRVKSEDRSNGARPQGGVIPSQSATSCGLAGAAPRDSPMAPTIFA